MTTVEFDPTAEDMPSVAVVRAVAAETDTPVEALDCALQDAIDTRALNRLFSATPDGTPRTPGDATVRFRFCGCDVTVDTVGEVVATRADTDR